MDGSKDTFSQIITCTISGTEFTQHSKEIFDDIAKNPKGYIKNLLTSLYEIFNSQDFPPHTKFYSLLLLVKATETKSKPLIEELGRSQDLLNKLFMDAQFDKSKPLGEKGKRLFSKNPTDEEAMTGRNYMVLLIEALAYWHKEFSSTNKKDPTNSFNIIYTNLSPRIQFPETYYYIGHKREINESFHLMPAEVSVSQQGATPGGNEDLETTEAYLHLITCVPSEEDYKANSNHVFDAVKRNSQQYNKDLLRSMTEVISKPSYGPGLKFYSLLLLAKLTEVDNKQFITQLAQEGPLLNQIAKDATAKMDKSSKDKDADAKYKKNYQVLVLEAIKFWHTRYGTSDEKNPLNNFTKLYSQLSKTVTYPKDYVYIKPPKDVPKDKQTDDKKTDEKKNNEKEKPKEEEVTDPIMRLVQTCIASGPAFKENSANIIDILKSGNKEKRRNYLKGTYKILDSPGTSPNSKFYALYLLVKTTETKIDGFMPTFAENQDFLNKLFRDGQFDSKKVPEQRATTFFSKKPTSDEAVLGTNYIQLLVECFRFWGQAYKTDDRKDPNYIFFMINEQLQKITKMTEENYYVGRDINDLDSKTLKTFEIIPFKSLPPIPKKSILGMVAGASQKKPPAPDVHEETKKPSDFEEGELEKKLAKLNQSKLLLAQYLENNHEGHVDLGVMNSLFEEVNSIYNNEVLKHVDSLVESSHGGKEKYVAIIFKEGDTIDKIEHEHANFLNGKTTYPELSYKVLPLLIGQDLSASTKSQGNKRVEQSDSNKDKKRRAFDEEEEEEHKNSKPNSPTKVNSPTQIRKVQHQASDLLSDDEKGTVNNKNQVAPQIRRFRSGELADDHKPQENLNSSEPMKSQGSLNNSQARPRPKIKEQKFYSSDLLEDEEYPKPSQMKESKSLRNSEPKPRVKIQNQKFLAGDLLEDRETPKNEYLAPKPVIRESTFNQPKHTYEDEEEEHQSFAPKSVMKETSINQPRPIYHEEHEEPISYEKPKPKVVPQSKNSVAESEVYHKNPIVINSPPSERGYLDKSKRMSPSKDYNMEMSKIGQSIKMSREKVSSLSTIQNSIKKSYLNAGKEPPNFKPLPDLGAMEGLEDEIARLNREREELKKENIALRDQTTNMIEDFEKRQKTNSSQIEQLKDQLNQYQNRIDTAQTELDKLKNEQAEKPREPVKSEQYLTPRSQKSDINKDNSKRPSQVLASQVIESMKNVSEPPEVEKSQHNQQQKTPVQADNMKTPIQSNSMKKSTLPMQGSPIIDSFITGNRTKTPDRPHSQLYQHYNSSPQRQYNTDATSTYVQKPPVKTDYLLASPITSSFLPRDKEPETSLYKISSGPSIQMSPAVYRQDRSNLATGNYSGIQNFMTPDTKIYNYNKAPNGGENKEKKPDYSNPYSRDNVVYFEPKPNNTIRRSPKPANYRHNLLAGLKLRIKDSDTSGNTINNYKTACLVKECPLFKNKDLEIIITSSTPSFQVSGRSDLYLTLDFINKGTLPLRDFSVIYSEVHNTTLSKRNEISNEVIEGGRQLRQQVVFSFEQWPLQVPQLYAEYKAAGKREDVNVYLPTLITQFMNFKYTDTESFRRRFDQEARNCIESDEIFLDSSVIRRADDFNRYFSFLAPLNQGKSQMQNDDVTLAGTFKLSWQRSDYLVKIHLVRNQNAKFTILAQDDSLSLADVILETFTFLFGKD